ncbi:hypothetical protein PQX77_021583 [Marasmius sp. AFHP31]|nr:hypothetical protein PQX77_021583 [Marasmius sp. AFHP31]
MFEHADTYMEMLVDIGFGYNRIVSLLDNPGFYNLLYSSSFNNLLRRFPLEHLSGYALEVLVHITTDSGMLEMFANGDLVPFLVNLLEKELEHLHGLGEDDKPKNTRQVSLASRSGPPFPHEPMSPQPGPSSLQEPIATQITTVHPTFTLDPSVWLTDDSSAIPSEFPPLSTICTHPGLVPVNTHRLHRLQPHTSLIHKPLLLQSIPRSHAFPAWSTSPHANNSAIHHNSAFNSHHASQHTIGHEVQPQSNHIPVVMLS